MAVAQYTDKTVRGDLGGVPVAIPHYFAEYVEYDGDPGWGEKRKGPKPVRTQESKIASFGFDVRYPDMVGKDSSENWSDYKNRKIGTTTWIRVGLNSAGMYSGSGSIARLSESSLKSMLDPASHPPYAYEMLDQKEYDLDVYAPKGFDFKNQKPYREHANADDVFVGSESGDVVAYIKCSNSPFYSAPCNHKFSLEPNMHADVSIYYRRGLLSDWRKIQDRVTDVVFGFAVSK